MGILLKVLVVGNHTCANRGDAAILRGLLNCLRENVSENTYEVMSRYPKAAKMLLHEEALNDPLYARRKRKRSKLEKKIDKVSPIIVGYLLDNPRLKPFFPMPSHYKAFLEIIDSYDLIIQVGGSFLVDLYGINQFEYILLSLYAGKKVQLLGHSIGPFDDAKFAWLAKKLLPRVDRLMLREEQSYKLYEALGGDLQNVQVSGDTAWLMPRTLRREPSRSPQSPRIAFTVRELGPFEARLGVSQEDYEMSMALLLDYLADEGYGILGLSTCTPLDGYDKDDRVVANRVRDKMRRKDVCQVVFSEENDLEFGRAVSDCSLLIGTRLHSCIISMRYGIPALGVLYEHKAKGVFDRLGLSKFCINIPDLSLPSTRGLVEELLQESMLPKLCDSVASEMEQTKKAIIQSICT